MIKVMKMRRRERRDDDDQRTLIQLWVVADERSGQSLSRAVQCVAPTPSESLLVPVRNGDRAIGELSRRNELHNAFLDRFRCDRLV
jgi:hypothetical protein